MANGNNRSALFTSGRRSRRGIGVFLIAALLLLTLPQPGQARWHSQVQDLPGITSGGEIARNLAIAGGIAAGAIFVYMKFFRGKSKSKAPLDDSQLKIKDDILDTGKTYNSNAIRNPLDLSRPVLSGTNARFPMLHSRSNSSFQFSLELQLPDGARQETRAPSTVQGGAELELTSFR